MKTLIELYKSILASVGMTSDTQGFVSTLLPGSDSPKPFSVESKRLVLPTEEQLKQPDWSNRIGFHPLLQNLTGGESRVMEKFRDRMNSFSDFMLGMLLVDVAQLGVREEMHKDLTPAQAAYLGPFSDADEKFVKLLTDLVATKRLTKKNFEFIRFSVIKGRIWEGQKRSRVAVLHFPLYEALPKENKPVTILGHKLRVVDVKMLRAMYEFLFPGIQEPGHYEIGSDSKIAPSLESLMALYARYVRAQNHAIDILAPVINTNSELLIVDDWQPDLADVSKYLSDIRKIPLLEGNAPSDRVTTIGATPPHRIGDAAPATMTAKTVVSYDTAPTITASTVAQHISQPNQQEVQQVQNNSTEGQPRFKLGTRAPVVTGVNATHQISDTVANQVNSGLSYARPAPLAPTPPVGSILEQQQPPLAQQQQFARQQFQQQQQIQPQQPQAMKVPDSARLINGALYIPVDNSGVSGVPQGAVLVDGKVFIPLSGVGVAPVAAFQQQQQQQQGRFGVQQQVTDPSQVPGLSASDIDFYRGNPVMFQNYLAQLGATQVNQAQNVLNQRQQAVPRYLQQAQAQSQQNQFTNRGFFNR